jgi:DNA-binding IclR family transcriptional regulator
MARPALSAIRALGVLNFLASHAPEQFTLSDISSRLDVNLASTHAVLAVLEGGGYVVRHPRLRTYSLGPSVVALGSAALECHPAIDHARDEARRLSEELDLAVAVTALAGDEIVFLGRVGEHRARGIEAYVGQRIPLVPPVGAVFVAWHDAPQWLARAADPEAMQAVLDEVRRRGWAASFEGDEYRVLGSLDPAGSYDVVMIAAPVFGPSREAVVALTLLGLPGGLSSKRIEHFGGKVRDAGLVATRRSGGRAPSAGAATG